MKKSTRQQPKTTRTIQPVSTDELRHVIGGANFVFVKPTKSQGGLDLSTED